ncbi:MAG: hypothetical protein NZM37_12805 [Sandaracinaceae bacterium]|nr:hypothetical protein [Sandaracinaceae bacterium]
MHCLRHLFIGSSKKSKRCLLALLFVSLLFSPSARGDALPPSQSLPHDAKARRNFWFIGGEAAWSERWEFGGRVEWLVTSWLGLGLAGGTGWAGKELSGFQLDFLSSFWMGAFAFPPSFRITLRFGGAVQGGATPFQFRHEVEGAWHFGIGALWIAVGGGIQCAVQGISTQLEAWLIEPRLRLSVGWTV